MPVVRFGAEVERNGQVGLIHATRECIVVAKLEGWSVHLRTLWYEERMRKCTACGQRFTEREKLDG